MRSPLRSPAQVEGTQGFLPQPEKDLERPSSTPLEARFPYHGSGAVTRSPSPLARSEEHTSELQSPTNLVCRLLLEKKNTSDTPLSTRVTNSLSFNSDSRAISQ